MLVSSHCFRFGRVPCPKRRPAGAGAARSVVRNESYGGSASDAPGRQVTECESMTPQHPTYAVAGAGSSPSYDAQQAIAFNGHGVSYADGPVNAPRTQRTTTTHHLTQVNMSQPLYNEIGPNDVGAEYVYGETSNILLGAQPVQYDLQEPATPTGADASRQLLPDVCVWQTLRVCACACLCPCPCPCLCVRVCARVLAHGRWCVLLRASARDGFALPPTQAVRVL